MDKCYLPSSLKFREILKESDGYMFDNTINRNLEFTIDASFMIYGSSFFKLTIRYSVLGNPVVRTYKITNLCSSCSI